MKFTILAICVAVTAAKPHIYLYNGPSAAPIGRDGRVIDTPEVTLAKTAHLAALASASAKASSASSAIPATTYGVFEPAIGYQGPPAPLAEDGRVIDTVEVAQLKAERLSALEKANAEAAAAEASAAVHAKGHAVYGVPTTVVELQEVPTFIMAQPIVAPVQGYKGPLAMIGPDGRVIDTEEVAKLKAEHLATLAEAQAKAAALAAASSSSSSSEDYTDEAVAVQYSETVAVPKPLYSGPLAPLGEDGRVIDTEEVAKLKAEHLAALEKANAAAIAFAAASGASMSTLSAEGYTYVAPVVHETHTIPIEAPVIKPQQGYNGPLAPLGEDGRVIDTEEVAKLKAEHLAALDQANAAAAAFAAASGSSMSTISSEGYTYVAPVVQYTESHAIETPSAKPQQVYNGPLAPLGEDGRVIDTEEVAKLKAEHLAALDKANAAAAAFAAASGASMSTISSEGYTYVAPVVQHIETLAIKTPVKPQGYNGPLAPLGEDGRVIDTEEVAKLKAEHLAALDQANAAAAAFAAASGSSMSTISSEGYTYVAPVVQYTESLAIETPSAKPQQVYNGPLAPLGEDGRVIDTEEVAKLKAEHLEALEKANAAAIALAAASKSSTSTLSSEGYTYVAPVVQPTQTLVIETPAVKPQQGYNGPLAPLGEDGRVIDTEEVAKLKAEHLAALEQANAAAAAFAAASGASMSTISSEGYTYVAPVVQYTESLAIESPAVKPQQVYNGPPAPLGEDGRVIDTEEVAKLKAEHLAALDQANAAAAAFAAASGSSMSTISSEGYTYVAPVIREIHAIPIEIIKPQQGYNGPLAPLGEDGRVIDTEEVAKLKSEHLAALEKANAAAIALAAESGSSMSTISSEGYTYVAPVVQHIETLAIKTPVKPQGYNGPLAPLGEDGRVIDTEEVAKLKAEHLAALDQANAAAAAFAAASGASMSTISSEGYTYAAPVVHETHTIPIEAPVIKPQQGYNGPLAPLGEDGRVVDTEEVAKLKADHLAALEKANAAAIALAAASGSSMSTFSSEGYTYIAPVVQHTEALAIAAPVAKPHQFYNGPPAPIGEDGRVIDTQEVAKLKTEHLATLTQAHAAASAFAAASSSSSSSATYGAPASSSSSSSATYGAPASSSSSSSATYGAPASSSPSSSATYGAPAVIRSFANAEAHASIKPQQTYGGPLAPLSADGQVVDTNEVAQLRAEHLATLAQANAKAEASAATASSSSSAEVVYGAPAVIRSFANAEAHASVKPQQTYGGPLAPLSKDGQVVDTNEVAQLRAEHLATLAQANAKAEASAATASSSSSAEVVYGAPVVRQIQTFVAAAPIAKPNAYRGPPAPLSEDGHVVDTDEVARLKAERLAILAEANAKAIAEAAAEAAKKPEAVVYSPPLPAVQTLPSFTAKATEVKPAPTLVPSHALVRRVVLRRPWTGPLAPLGENGRVVDTKEVAKLKAERLSTLKNAFSHAIELANAKKTAESSAEVIESAAQESKGTFQGYLY